MFAEDVVDWPVVTRQSCRQSELYLLMTISVVEIAMRQEDKTFGEIGSTCRTEFLPRRNR